jgi:hypothetical protein
LQLTWTREWDGVALSGFTESFSTVLSVGPPVAVEGLIQKTVALLLTPARRQPPGDWASLRFDCEKAGAVEMTMKEVINSWARM